MRWAMKSVSIVLLIIVIYFPLSGQNAAATNEIYRDTNGNLGVKSIKGDVIIEPLYRGINNIYSNSKLILPPNAKLDQKLLEYYIVMDSLYRLAIFKSDGSIVFDFVETSNLMFDEYTQTIITAVKRPDNRMRYSLLALDNTLILEEDFKRIGYILNTDLLVLEKEKREIYLYNPFTKLKVGPYDLVNVYDEHFDPTMGLPNIKHNKLTKQVGIGVRINGEVWGFVDRKGNIALPIEYKDLRIIPYSMFENEILKADRPEGVNFVFYSYPIRGENSRIFIDEDLNVYDFDTSERTATMSGVISKQKKK